MEAEHLKHLYWRAGFGIMPKDLECNANKTTAQVVDELFQNSEMIEDLTIDLSEFKNLDYQLLKNNPQLIRETRQKIRKRLPDLNNAWLTKIATSKQVLRERMTLFWANHFVSGDKNTIYAQQFNNTLRMHALGNFKDFVKAVSKEASMINYLNLGQNRKAQPNENFARELMELFTLGDGHYSETDIKESARAFTGYSRTVDGTFKFRKYQHDDGLKTFFGKTGNFKGDDIIDIILEKRQCANFICKKIYRYFVNENIIDSHVDLLTDVFFKNYDIKNTMHYLFNQSWFYDDANLGAKIKSPVDFLVGLQKTVPVEFNNKKAVLRLQKLLGQTLLDPPNVAGWKGHKAWIDANTIMLRLKLPSVLLNGGMIALGNEKDEIRRQFFKNNKQKLPFKNTANWAEFQKNFKNIDSESLASILLNGNINNGTKSYIASLDKSSKQAHCIQLMSLPEYQMC
ncbi:DUF1800 family protein [Winogradskyella litorisediminis]|uniref:DUF1800 family protein n=1 Tax=Winogradskyella litorisediminis TaxID=1156618 RepID=A0ABW3N4Z3_9FLAO